MRSWEQQVFSLAATGRMQEDEFRGAKQNKTNNKKTRAHTDQSTLNKLTYLILTTATLDSFYRW